MRRRGPWEGWGPERPATLTVSLAEGPLVGPPCEKCLSVSFGGLCKDCRESYRNRLGTRPFPTRRVPRGPENGLDLLPFGEGVQAQYWCSHDLPEYDWYVTTDQRFIVAKRGQHGSLTEAS